MFRIFLAEDDPAIVRVLENQLSVWGYSVWCVQDFRQVMAEFCGPEFKILLVTGKNRWETHTLGGLLPLAFGADMMEKK